MQTDTPFVATRPIHVGFLLVDQFEALDLTGMRTAFQLANQCAGEHYTFQTIALNRLETRSECGLVVLADIPMSQAKPYDLLVIPGGKGCREVQLSKEQRTALLDLIDQSTAVATICTGAYLLAKLGCLDHQTSAIHWAFQEDFQQRFPDIQVDGNSIFCRSGKFWTSGGITAGIDMALAIIADHMSESVADRVARMLNIYVRRPGNQAQYSVPLALQAGESSDFAWVIDYVLRDPVRDISVATLANEIGMSERNFFRKFSETTGTTPARFVERLRLDVARQLLASSSSGLEIIAAKAGFNSADAFSRAFKRVFSVSPAMYRNRFNQKVTS